MITFQAIVSDSCTDIENIVGVTGTYNDEEVSDQDSVFIRVECPPEPCLRYSPHGYDFGYMQECEKASTVFEIWNGCDGVLEYTVTPGCPWVTVNRTSGSSAGEHDSINVTINTAGFYSGTFNCTVNITSNGGNGTFNITVTVGQEPKEPSLSFSPHSYDFGVMDVGEMGSTSFEIWNSGTGSLVYSLFEDCDWVTLSTMSGSSVGEHDTVEVNVDISGLSEGVTYTCDVLIDSDDGGSGVFIVSVTVNSSNGSGNRSPVVSIVEPQCKIYFMGRAFVYFPRPLFIGGPVEIRVNASDPDGTVTYVEFYVGDVLLGNVSSEPYCYNWDERAFGFRTITVKAYDNEGKTAEDTIDVIIFNFGLHSSR